MKTKRIAILTGTRADWGLLSPIASELSRREGVKVDIIATNMHLSERYGHTIDEIRADGFAPEEVPVDTDDDTPRGKLRAMAQCQEGVAMMLEKLGTDLVVILGDRFEMLAAATAALMMRVPVVHISGGEISEGAIDDSIRHAITKMSSLHLTACETYRRRVIAMGESPDRVINTGAIGVYNLLNGESMSASALSESIGFTVDGSTLLVTYHPATLDDNSSAKLFANLLEALDRFPDNRVLFTYPNNDAGGRAIISMIEEYVARNPGRAFAVPSLGRVRYLSALKTVAAVAGNSSSGIVEVPSAGIPTVDIGIRQQGRLRSESVIHADDSVHSIAAAISRALSPEMRAIAAAAPNPYCAPDTLARIVGAIAEADPSELRMKKFYDIIPLS
ncbi:MAG: UDP-N-acetylglucosamine 2-epimerase (hydrolyzing) [Duncaniella sp.]|nr:UDP-N-acetylglucosamine 2-epimerase (hydrolyzing) [Duncaniella sp.]